MKFPHDIPRFKVPIYGFWVYCPFTRADADRLNAWFRVEPSGKHQAGFVSRLENADSGDTRLVLAAFHHDDPAYWMQVAAHESLHCAYYVLDFAGVRHTVDNHEVLAYTMDHIFGEVMERYAKWKKKQGTLSG